MSFVMSLMYNKNNNGPKMVPCDTPDIQVTKKTELYLLVCADDG